MCWFHFLGSYLLHPVALLDGFWGELCCLSLFCLVTAEQAADDQVKIKITKYKTGSSPGGEVKVQEMGEGDPQWQHIKDVVKEQLEKAGLKAEGMKGGVPETLTAFFLSSLIWNTQLCIYLLIFVKKHTIV